MDRAYIQPKFFFHYTWIYPLPQLPLVVYTLYAIMIFCCVLILSNYKIRGAAIVLLFLFSWFELSDLTHYLNHYYLIILLIIHLILIPKNSFYPKTNKGDSSLAFHFLQFQIFMVYLLAAIAKLNPEWLLKGQPMNIWLHNMGWPETIIPSTYFSFTSIVMSWAGCLYDFTVPFLLLFRRTKILGIILVFIFHTCTAIFFQIGIFPYLMMGISLIFLPESFHKKIISTFVFNWTISKQEGESQPQPSYLLNLKSFFYLLFFLMQFILAFRYVAYPGDVLWTERGFRWSWRVMLIDKKGNAQFYVKIKTDPTLIPVNNEDFLTGKQEVFMSYQSDLIQLYAKKIRSEYTKKGFQVEAVYADVFVSLNGSVSRRFVKNSIDLSQEPIEKWLITDPQ